MLLVQLDVTMAVVLMRCSMFRVALSRSPARVLARSMSSMPADIKSYTRGLFFGHVNAKQVWSLILLSMSDFAVL
jgi:hypothetical protein